MTDEQQSETKRAPGRPKGAKTKRRNAVREPIHQPVHVHDSRDILENFEYAPELSDALHIDHQILDAIRREWGYETLWVAFEVAGKAFPDRVNLRKKNGFAEICKGNFGGALDHKCDKDGRITKEGLVLMARPVEIGRIARAYEARMAKSAIQQMKRSHAEEGIPVEGGDHPSALAKNRHKQTFEPLDKIPD